MLRLGLGRSSQARRQHHVLLLASEPTGLRCEGIIVLADDVNLLALLLRRAVAERFQLGAVIPVGTTGTALAARACTWTESRSTRRSGWRRRRGPRNGGCCLGAITTGADGSSIRTTRWRYRRTTRGLLQLHELTGCNRFAHAWWHGWAIGTCAAALSSTWSACIAAVAAAIPPDGFSDELKGAAGASSSGSAGRGAGTRGSTGPLRTGGTLWSTGALPACRDRTRSPRTRRSPRTCRSALAFRLRASDQFRFGWPLRRRRRFVDR